MKKFLIFSLIVSTSIMLCGSGYKGTLPDLNIMPVNEKKEIKTPTKEILPLDKLTIPMKKPEKVDKTLTKYIADMNNAITQLERLQGILQGDKSFKNFIAAANMLDLTTQNIISEFKENRFYPANALLENICYDVQQIKNYWIKVAKNAPYVSYYATQGAYSGAVLNEQLNSFSEVLTFAIQDLKSKTKEIE